jgi:hypothetical protein
MQDNDFDKIFSHKFGQQPGEPYSEENWSELSRRMDIHSRRRTRWVLPAMFFLLGALTGSNVFWWYQWREADRKLQSPESRTSLFQTDTMTRRTVVYHYDTIYQNVTVVRRQEIAAPLQFSTNAPSNSFSFNDIPEGNATVRQNQTAGINPVSRDSYDLTQQVDSSSLNVQEQEGLPISNGDAAAPVNTIVHKTPMDTSELATPPLSSVNAATDTLFENLLKSQPPPTKKVPTGLIYFARPRVGVSATLGFPSFPHKLAGTLFGAGIRSDIEIARNFRLGAEVAYQQASLKADDTEVLEDLDIDIPDPGGDYRLKYWETYFLPAFTYSMHLRYEIPLRGKWTPWFGVGGQAITMLPFEIEYEFENEFNNVELHIPAKAGSSTNWQGMLFMLGVECRLNPHLYFGAEGYMIRHFGENEDEHEGEGRSIISNQLGIKTSIIYKF